MRTSVALKRGPHTMSERLTDLIPTRALLYTLLIFNKSYTSVSSDFFLLLSHDAQNIVVPHTYASTHSIVLRFVLFLINALTFLLHQIAGGK